jgi:4-amino-4-deoxy-L-arabinose transferase-like glycosyltransferase
VHTAWVKSFTIDEPHYVGTGRYLWQSGDYDWLHTLFLQPPLAFHLASIPLLVIDVPALEPGRDPGHRLVARSDDPLTGLRVASRLPFIALALWGAVLVFAWAREAAGPRAGLLAAFTYTFSPAIAGYGSLAHSDVAGAVFYLQTLYTFWRWWRRPSALRLCLCGLSLGLALATKMNAVLLPPTLALVLAVSLWRPGEGAAPASARARGAQWTQALAVIGLVSLGVMWLAYGGSFGAARNPEGPFGNWLVPGYLHALFTNRETNQTAHEFWFFGAIRAPAWYFLPVAFLVKTPLPTLLLAVAAACAPRAPGLRSARLARFVGIPAAIYALVACFYLEVPLGLRYLLPLYPLLFIFIGVKLAPLRTRAPLAAVGLACVWLAVVSLAAHPHYIAYFNAAAGGAAHGHEHFADSNLDWGQDVGTLARWLEERGNPPIYTALFSAQRPQAFGIRSRRLRGCRPVRTGLVAISAAVLRGVVSPHSVFRRPEPGCYDWLLEHDPVAMPGYSILVYDLPGGAARRPHREP